MAKAELIDTEKTMKSSEDEMITKEASSEKNQGGASSMFSKLSETLTFKVNKPLIPLKIAVFCWFGAGAVITPFLALYLKQRGLSLNDLTIIYMILPIFQFLGPTISGAIADKLGRSKPVLQANLLLSIISATAMLFIPKTDYCNQELIHCKSNVTDDFTMSSYCDVQGNGSESFSCSFQCSLDLSHQLKEFCFQDYISSCDLLSQHGILHNFTWSANASKDEKYAECVTELKPNSTDDNFWCLNHLVHKCNSTCEQNLNATATEPACEDGGTRIFIISFALLAAFHTFFTNSFRIIDVTAMSMIKTYNSDFGRQRFWSILGVLAFSPLSGYVIGLVSPENGPQRYDTAFYLFNVMAVLTMIVVWKLEVKTEPPTENLLRKTLLLLRNLDVMAFFTAVLVIGTAWGFTKLFSSWYLEELKAPSSLIGLVPAVNSAIGLPFLLTSKWFVAKFGSSNLLILSLLGYSAWCTGYSFLQNPWWSLPYEVFGILNYHLLWVTVITQSHEIAPVGFAATTISIAGGIHFGVGKGTGSLIGGFIMSKFGGRLAYRVMAAICVGCAVLYAVFTVCRKRTTKKEMDLEKIETGSTLKFDLDEKFTPLILF